MDGTLSFFEQDQPGFERFIPGFLIPGPLCYVPRLDSIVTCSASCYVESYRYPVLAAAQVQGKTEKAIDDDIDPKQGRAGKKISQDWSVNIGEHALEIKLAESDPQKLIVLGERTLFWLSEAGIITASKRFEAELMCCNPYRVVDDVVQLLVVTHDQVITVIKGTTIVWAAHLSGVPVAVDVGELRGTKGLIIALEDTGKLDCYYLGTDPGMPIVSNQDMRELDYTAMDKEMKQLQGSIRDTLINANTALPARVVEIAVGIPVLRDSAATVEVTFSYSESAPLENVTINVETVAPILCDKPTIELGELGGGIGGAQMIKFTFSAAGDVVPYDLTVRIVASYIVEADPRSVEASVDMPAGLVATVAPPNRNAGSDIFNFSCVKLEV